jgi:hypothetical protein
VSTALSQLSEIIFSPSGASAEDRMNPDTIDEVFAGILAGGIIACTVFWLLGGDLLCLLGRVYQVPGC